MSSYGDIPCPVCFETANEGWPTHKAHYSDVHNHSWGNGSRCDAHGVCWGCLAKHVEVQVLSEGKCSVRCPGEGCHYHLLFDDVRTALCGSPTEDKVLEVLTHLSNQSCQHRLKDVVFDTLGDESGQWLRDECQPCPFCFVLARRETGCDHIVCRCGCDFCFTCGAPNSGHGEAGCICHCFEREPGESNVFFAAWLRSAYASPCEWLKDFPPDNKPAHFVKTFGFWLWMSGAEITPPESWYGHHQRNVNQTALPPLAWNGTDGYVPYCGFDLDEFDENSSEEPLEQELAGHLRKEAYSIASHRVLRRVTQRRSTALITYSALESDNGCGSEVTARVIRHERSKAGRRKNKAARHFQIHGL